MSLKAWVLFGSLFSLLGIFFGSDFAFGVLAVSI